MKSNPCEEVFFPVLVPRSYNCHEADAQQDPQSWSTQHVSACEEQTLRLAKLLQETRRVCRAQANVGGLRTNSRRDYVRVMAQSMETVISGKSHEKEKMEHNMGNGMVWVLVLGEAPPCNNQQWQWQYFPNIYIYVCVHTVNTIQTSPSGGGIQGLGY